MVAGFAQFSKLFYVCYRATNIGPFQKGANTVEEAVTAYYDNPDKYNTQAAENLPKKGKSEKNGAFAPPAVPKGMSTGIANGMPSGNDILPSYHATEQTTIHHHTNQVIQAAHVRAQDEVHY